MAGNADIASVEMRHICPDCGSWDTIIMKRTGSGGMVKEEYVCRQCKYDSRRPVKYEKKPLWRWVFGKRVD